MALLFRAVEAKNTNLVIDPNILNEKGQTLLHVACMYDNPECIQILVKAQSAVTVNDKWYNTPLHIACKYENPLNVRELLKVVKDVDLLNNNGWTPLHMACERGNTESVRLLIQAGATINIQNDYKQTALHKACWAGYDGCVLELLRSGANPDLCDQDGKTPLHLAVFAKSLKCVRHLIDHHADLNIVDHKGHTPLYESCLYYTPEVTISLILKSNLDVQTNYGETVLHYACRNNMKELVRLLLQAGADASLKNNNGVTALRIAEIHKYDEIIQLIKDYDIPIKEPECSD